MQICGISMPFVLESEAVANYNQFQLLYSKTIAQASICLSF